MTHLLLLLVLLLAGTLSGVFVNGLYVVYIMIYKPIQMHYAVSHVVLQQEAHV